MAAYDPKRTWGKRGRQLALDLRVATNNAFAVHAVVLFGDGASGRIHVRCAPRTSLQRQRIFRDIAVQH